MMTRESLTRVRTFREVMGSLDRARVQRPIKATNILDRAKPLEPPANNGKVIAIALEKEQRRFKRQWETLDKAHKKIQGVRQKMANLREKNKRIMELRLALSKQYWQDTRSEALGAQGKGADITQTLNASNAVKLKY